MGLPSDQYEEIRCNLCGNDNYKIFFDAKYDFAKYHDLSEKFRSSGDETLIDQVVQCQHCGLVYINPRLNEDIIIRGYSEGVDELFVSQAEARVKTFNQTLKVIEKYSPQKGKILDIGTAAGSFLFAAKQRGWEVEGCEPNRWLGQWGRKQYGVQIKSGTVFDQDYSRSHFDVITLWDVLEHTGDPKRTLIECKRILKAQGILIINYPDIGTWIAKIMGRKWVFWLSVHLYYFTKKTIRRMLEQCGFEIIKIRPHFQKLQVGYIFKRASAYFGPFRWIEKFISIIGLGKLNVPYWVGQTLVIARIALETESE